jgi:hypothetical protein
VVAKFKPGGKTPLVTDQVIVVDPVAMSLWLYALLTEAPGKETLVITGSVKALMLKTLEL